ncbi:MAG: sigma-70 family RNA polymerase sigma factor, partial [Christensenellaceae bacterium]
LSRKDSDELIKLKTLRKEMSGGDPTAAELAEAMDVSEERVLELLEISRSSSVVSLDLETNEDGMSIRDTLGRDDDEFIKFENRDFLNKAIADLPENERMIIYYRYVRGMSQRDVAEKMGVSQMSVSRSERKILGKLREKIQAG